MARKNLILIGGGGHCHSAIDVIETCERFRILGIIEHEKKDGAEVLGYPVIGTDEEIPRLVGKQAQFLITVGYIRLPCRRASLFKKLKSWGLTGAVVISPHATISKRAILGEGTIALHHSYVGANARIGENCILNTGCLVEHDCVVGNHTHVATGAIVNGGCSVGEQVLLGSQSVLLQGMRIASDSLIGAGTVVVKNITDAGTFVGKPASNITSGAPFQTERR